MGKAEIAATTEIYNVARQQADEEMAKLRSEIESIREESQAMGVLQKIEYDIAHNQMLKYVVLHRIKTAKEYRKGGMTWAQFCEANGESVRSTDQILTELQPVFLKFSARFADFAGMNLNKVRLLGRTISADSAEITEDGMVVINGERIPFTPDHRDDLQAALEHVIETNARLLAEKETTIKTKDRLLKRKAEMIHRQERKLTELEDKAAYNGLTPEEETIIQRCDNARTTIDGFLLQFDPEHNPLPADATPRMMAAYMGALAYFRRAIIGACDSAGERYGDIDLPEHQWIPPHLRNAGEE